MEDISSPSHVYTIDKLVGDNPAFRLYLCTQEETGRQCLLQIPPAVTGNGAMDRAAYILRELKRLSDETEADYAPQRKNPQDMLNYHLGFPELVDSFICKAQGKRRINILAFHEVDDPGNMSPLVLLTEKDRVRIDLKTSPWILGKILKLLVFTHNEGFAIGCTDNTNIVIQPAPNHYAVLFDWSATQIYPGGIPMDKRRDEIMQAAQAVIIALGGDPATGYVPDDGEDGFKPYIDHVMRLARGSESNAQRAHGNFYDLVRSLWGNKFHPFKTFPLTTRKGR